jgi:hypothetical protein
MTTIGSITLWDANSGALIASMNVQKNEFDELLLQSGHPTLSFEFDCALYGLQEGGVNHDSIDDDDGNPYINWQFTAV